LQRTTTKKQKGEEKRSKMNRFTHYLLLLHHLLSYAFAKQIYDCQASTGIFTLDNDCITLVTIDVTDVLEIAGSRTTIYSISGAEDHQILTVNTDAVLTLTHLELKNGKGTNGNNGGAVSIKFNGQTSFTFVIFTSNLADSGGAVAVADEGKSSIVGCRFEKNICQQSGNDIYISKATTDVILVNNEYSNINNGKGDVSGLTSVVKTCDAQVDTSSSKVCRDVNPTLLNTALCVLRQPAAKGVQCTPTETPVVHKMISNCNGVKAKYSSDHSVKGCAANGGNTLNIVGTGFGGTRGTVTIQMKVTTDRACDVTTWTDTQVICTLPAMIGKDKLLVITNVKSKKTNQEGVRTLGRELYGASDDTVTVDSPKITKIGVGDKYEPPSTIGGEVLNIVGSNFGNLNSFERSILLGSNHWVNNTDVTYISDTQLTIVVPPGAGVHEVIVYVDYQPSVAASTFDKLQYRRPFIEEATVGLFGGMMIIRGTDFGPNFNVSRSTSELTRYPRMAEDRTLCEQPIECADVISQNNTQQDLVCE